MSFFSRSSLCNAFYMQPKLSVRTADWLLPWLYANNQLSTTNRKTDTTFQPRLSSTPMSFCPVSNGARCPWIDVCPPLSRPECPPLSHLITFHYPHRSNSNTTFPIKSPSDHSMTTSTHRYINYSTHLVFDTAIHLEWAVPWVVILLQTFTSPEPSKMPSTQ